METTGIKIKRWEHIWLRQLLNKRPLIKINSPSIVLSNMKEHSLTNSVIINFFLKEEDSATFMNKIIKELSTSALV
jgi:hypothetical protein